VRPTHVARVERVEGRASHTCRSCGRGGCHMSLVGRGVHPTHVDCVVGCMSLMWREAGGRSAHPWLTQMACLLRLPTCSGSVVQSLQCSTQQRRCDAHAALKGQKWRCLGPGFCSGHACAWYVHSVGAEPRPRSHKRCTGSAWSLDFALVRLVLSMCTEWVQGHACVRMPASACAHAVTLGGAWDGFNHPATAGVCHRLCMYVCVLGTCACAYMCAHVCRQLCFLLSGTVPSHPPCVCAGLQLGVVPHQLLSGAHAEGAPDQGRRVHSHLVSATFQRCQRPGLPRHTACAAICTVWMVQRSHLGGGRGMCRGCMLLACMRLWQAG